MLVALLLPCQAVVQASTSWSIMRLCSVLFGDMVGQVMDYLCDDAPMAWHQKVGRNHPNQGGDLGDCSTTIPFVEF